MKVILESVIVLLETQALLKNVQLSVYFEQELPMITCSEIHLKQVFINMIKNSIEAIPEEGEIKIHVSKKSESHVFISFVDNGIGIPEERLQQLGEPFYTTKEKVTGLGLMMCFKIIEAHQGKIHVTSSQGIGTKIDITLPIDFQR